MIHTGDTPLHPCQSVDPQIVAGANHFLYRTERLADLNRFPDNALIQGAQPWNHMKLNLKNIYEPLSYYKLHLKIPFLL
jgi:hypothetical protein